MCIAFNHEAFAEGHKLWMLECWSQIAEHHQEIDLSLDEESNKEPFDRTTIPDVQAEVIQP